VKFGEIVRISDPGIGFSSSSHPENPSKQWNFVSHSKTKVLATPSSNCFIALPVA
jgi:hypothetical protein